MPARVLVLPALLMAGLPAAAGVVFREVESVERPVTGDAWTEAREVHCNGSACRVVISAPGDEAPVPARYVLVTQHDAFHVDTAREEIAPAEPTLLRPVDDDRLRDRSVAVRDVVLTEEPPRPDGELLGRPLTRRVFELRFSEARADADGGEMRHEERHEVWSAAPRPGEEAVAWRAWRLAADAGEGLASAELREALERIQGDGLPLRHHIQRRTAAVTGQVVEQVRRELTSIASRDFPPDFFSLPAGYAQTEFLAPVDDDPAAEAP